MCSDENLRVASGMYILELSYRLTVAINMSANKLGTVKWRESWNAGIRACAEAWRDYLSSAIGDEVDEHARLYRFAKGFFEIFSRGNFQLTDEELSFVKVSNNYRHIRKYIAAAAKDIQLEHLDFYMLGRQLAQSDICTYSSALENKELTEIFNNRFTPITEDYFPISLQNWLRAGIQ